MINIFLLLKFGLNILLSLYTGATLITESIIVGTITFFPIDMLIVYLDAMPVFRISYAIIILAMTIYTLMCFFKNNTPNLANVSGILVMVLLETYAISTVIDNSMALKLFFALSFYVIVKYFKQLYGQVISDIKIS